MVTISNTAFGFTVLLILVGICIGGVVWINYTSASTANVLLMIENNDPKVHWHTHNHNLTHEHSATSTQLAGMQSELDAQRGIDLSLQRQIDERTLPTQPSTQTGESNFRLDINENNINVGDSFKLSGVDKANTPFILSMVGSDRSDVLPQSGQTFGNGEFEIGLFVPNGWQPGVYTITVIIGQNYDRITFNVAP